MHRRHAPLGEQQIGEAKQLEELRLFLRQPAIAGLAMPEEVLDHMKRMLDLRPDAGSVFKGVLLLLEDFGKPRPKFVRMLLELLPRHPGQYVSH